MVFFNRLAAVEAEIGKSILPLQPEHCLDSFIQLRLIHREPCRSVGIQPGRSQRVAGIGIVSVHADAQALHQVANDGTVLPRHQLTRSELRLHPTRKTASNCCIQSGKDAAKGVMRWYTIRHAQKLLQAWHVRIPQSRPSCRDLRI